MDKSLRRTCRTLAMAAFVSTSAAFGQATLTPEIAVGLKSVEEAVLNQTGQRVAYVLSVPRDADDDPGKPYSEIWVADVEGGGSRRYTRTADSASSPRWSPDGKYLAFLSQRDEQNEETQVYRLAIDGGEAEPLTKHATSIAAFRWSPDGKWLAFLAPDAKSEEDKTDEEAGRDWTVVDQSPRPQRLWLMDTTTCETRSAYDGPLSTGDFVFTSDGQTLVIRAAQTPRTDDAMMYSRLYTLPRAGGEPQPICETAGKLGSMAVSPDGTRLAFLGATSLNDPLPQNLFVVSLPAGTPRNLTDGLEASAHQAAWIDNERLLLLITESCATRLLRVAAADGQREEVAAGPMGFAFDLHAASGRFALVGSEPVRPAEVFVGSVVGGALRRLSDSNPGLESLQLARQEVVTWQADDDLRLEGILLYPAGYEEGRRYPLVVNPHGGPEGASLNGWTTFGQLLAARGYFVLQPNYRGSGGRGVKFSQGDHNDLGGREFEDILAGVTKLIGDGLVDPQRIGMAGWSYGGYLSALAATHHSERFKAAVMGAGISNWISFSGVTDIPHEMSIVHWNQWWQDDPAMYWQRSPLSRMATVQTPTLILHGSDDERVPPGQGWELYTALKHKGVPTQFVLYPRSGHGVSERAHRLDLYTRQLDWFDHYLK